MESMLSEFWYLFAWPIPDFKKILEVRCASRILPGGGGAGGAGGGQLRKTKVADAAKWGHWSKSS